MLSDERQRELMQQALHGSRAERAQALIELYNDFRRPALAIIYKTLRKSYRDREARDIVKDAEDALHNAWEKFSTVGLKQYRGISSPRTYFIRIAINAALDIARQNRRIKNGEDVDGVQPPEDHLYRKKVLQALKECLELLPERYQRAILLYYFEEAGNCETCAKQVGVSKLTFMKHLSRGRQALADCIRRKLKE